MPNILFDITKTIPNEEIRILEVEKMIGMRLPEDYRQYLIQANGAAPYVEGFLGHPVFVRVHWRNKAAIANFGEEFCLHNGGVLLGNWHDYSPRMASDPRWRLQNVEGLPKDYLPIWGTAGGDFFLLGIRKHNYGQMYLGTYWQLDDEGNAVEDSLAFVANSFTEFIQMIEPEPDDWDLWEAAGKPRLPLSTEELEALARTRAKTAEKPPQPNFSAEKIRGARKGASGEKSTGE